MCGAPKASLPLTFAAIALALACSPAARLSPPRVDPAPQIRGGDAALQARYKATLARWTRRAELYDWLDARLFFAGTLLTPTFRAALDARDAALGLAPSALFSQSADADGEIAPAVLLGVYAHDARFDDFSGEQSIWQITLTTSQGTLRPEKIRRFSRPDHWLRSSFPYLDRFWVAYLITFPAQAQVEGGASFAWEEAVLNLQSVVGQATLNFRAPTPGDPAVQAP